MSKVKNLKLPQDDEVPNWIYVLILLAIIIYMSSGYPGGGLLFLLILYKYVQKNKQQIVDLLHSLLNISVIIIPILLSFLFMYYVVKSFASLGKYEGQTAKEWFYDYDYTTDCLDEIQTTAETYSYGATYEEMRDALEDISTTAQSCW